MKKFIRLLGGAAMGIALAMIATSYSSHADEYATLGLSIAPAPSGAPVIITDTTHQGPNAFSVIRVRNVSSKTTKSVSFGVLVKSRTDGNAAPLYLGGRSHATIIAPWASLDVRAELLSGPTLQQVVRDYPDGADVHAGIVRTEFDDGSTWNHDAKALGRFGPKVASATKPCGSWFAAVLNALQGGYKCDPSQHRERCSVAPDGQSCTNTICEAGPGCAYQKCALIVPDGE